MNGEITPAERPALEKLAEYREYKKIAESASCFQPPEFDEEKHLQKLQERLKKSPGKVRPLHIPSLYKYAALLVLLLASAWFIYYNTPETITTGTGEISFVSLPDNSEVRLNAESKIKYFPRKWEDNRNLSLEGEAFFEVEKGSNFTVETSQGTVQVLGTSFNVKSRNGFFEVVCYEGSVMVTRSGKETILLPKEFYLVIENKVHEGTAIPEEIPGWVNSESNFRDVPLKFVLEEIERQFGLLIEAENVDQKQLFTGSFSHKNRDTALRSITIPLGLKFRVTAENKVILYE